MGFLLCLDKLNKKEYRPFTGHLERTDFVAIITITTDFTGKVEGSLIENSNIAKKMLSEFTYSPLYEGWTEFTQNEYDLIETSGGISYSLYSTPPNFAHILFSFDLISAIEKVYGKLCGVVRPRKWIKLRL